MLHGRAPRIGSQVVALMEPIDAPPVAQVRPSRGRTLGGTAYTLSYDYDGQLTQITQGQTTTDFAYDALGRRFSRTAGGTTTEFVY
ncbi:MAG: hypothetical protein NT029_05285, partial [Armatimonadetes bacterium]|nr:hypothetical protein [Armatimonadota bacterium]